MPYNRRPDRLAAELVGVSGQQADLTGRRLQGLPPSPPSLSVGRTDRARRLAARPPSILLIFMAVFRPIVAPPLPAPEPVQHPLQQSSIRSGRYVVRRSLFPSLPRREKGGRAFVRPERAMDRQRPATYYVELAAGKKKVQPPLVALMRLSAFGTNAQILGWDARVR